MNPSASKHVLMSSKQFNQFHKMPTFDPRGVVGTLPEYIIGVRLDDVPDLIEVLEVQEKWQGEIQLVAAREMYVDLMRQCVTALANYANLGADSDVFSIIDGYTQTRRKVPWKIHGDTAEITTRAAFESFTNSRDKQVRKLDAQAAHA